MKHVRFEFLGEQYPHALEDRFDRILSAMDRSRPVARSFNPRPTRKPGVIGVADQYVKSHHRGTAVRCPRREPSQKNLLLAHPNVTRSVKLYAALDVTGVNASPTTADA